MDDSLLPGKGQLIEMATLLLGLVLLFYAMLSAGLNPFGG